MKQKQNIWLFNLLFGKGKDMEQPGIDPLKRRDKIGVRFIPASTMIMQLGIFSYGFCAAV